MSKCPLCGSTHVKEIDYVKQSMLRKVYLQEYQTDISEDVNGDMSLYHCASCDLKYFDPCYTGGQQFYSDLQKFEWYYKDEKHEFDYVSKFIKPKQKVLEIGCGKGAFTTKLKTKNYVGLEFSETGRELGRSLGREIYSDTIEDHANANKEVYDVVCSFQVLEHTDKPKSFLEGCVKALKPGGTLILTVPSENSFLEHIQDFALNMPPHHVTKWSDKCLSNICALNGLELVELYHEPLDSFHIPWFFNSMAVSQLNKTLGIKHSLLKHPRHWVSHWVSKLMFKVFGEGLPSAYQGHGHTVIAVYKKSASGRPK